MGRPLSPSPKLPELIAGHLNFLLFIFFAYIATSISFPLIIAFPLYMFPAFFISEIFRGLIYDGMLLFSKKEHLSDKNTILKFLILKNLKEFIFFVLPIALVLILTNYNVLFLLLTFPGFCYAMFCLSELSFLIEESIDIYDSRTHLKLILAR